MTKRRSQVLPATPEELELIAELTAEPAMARLDRGEAEIIDADDWSHVPQLSGTETLRLPSDVVRRLQRASRKRRTTPEKLAAELINHGLSAR